MSKTKTLSLAEGGGSMLTSIMPSAHYLYRLTSTTRCSSHLFVSTCLITSVALALVLVLSLQVNASNESIAGDVGPGVVESSSHTLAGALASASVEPSSGVLRASIPIEVPRARGSAQPSIKVTYSSSNGIREAGVGWGLDLPVIERNYKTPFGGYLFSGQPLVLVCKIVIDSCPGLAEPLPRWVLPGTEYYRLEKDTSLARIFMFPTGATWRVQFPGGEILELGNPLVPPNTPGNEGLDFESFFISDSTIPNTGAHNAADGRSIFRWNVVRQYDLPNVGYPRNLVVYRWGMRTNDGRGYLTDVYYTPPSSSRDESMPLDAFAHHLRLAWEKGAASNIDSNTGFWRATPKLVLSRLDVASKQWGKAAGPRELVRKHHFQYKYWTNVPVLSSFQVEGRCTQPILERKEELPVTSCPKLPPMTFRYSRGEVIEAMHNMHNPDAQKAVEAPVVPWRLVLSAKQFRTDELKDSPDSRSPKGETPLNFIPLDINSDGLPDLVEIGNYPRYIQGSGDPVPDPERNNNSIGQIVYWGGDELVSVRGSVPIGHRFAAVVRDPSSYLFMNKGYTLTGDFLGNGSTTALFVVPDDGPAVGVGPKLFMFKPLLGPTKPLEWTEIPNPGKVSWADKMQLAGDVNGDGRLDRVNWASARGESYFDKHFNPPSGGNLWLNWKSQGLFHTMFSTSGSPFSNSRATSLAPSLEMIEKASYFWKECISGLPGICDDIEHRSVFLADMNGDSLADLVAVGHRPESSTTVVQYWPGDGHGNFTQCSVNCPVVWPGNETPSVEMGLPYLMGFPYKNSDTTFMKQRIQFGDIDGDGFSDMVYWDQSGIRVFFNAYGYAFTEVVLPANKLALPEVGPPSSSVTSWFKHVGMDRVRIAIADMNGNGINDIVVIVQPDTYRTTVMGNPVVDQVWAIDLQRNDDYAGPIEPSDDFAPRPNLLVEIDNGLGAATKIMYESTADLYRASQRANRPWPEPLAQIMMVVGRITTTTNLSSSSYKVHRQVSYTYNDPGWDGYERRFRGFREVISKQGSPEEGDAGAIWTRQTYLIPPCPDNGFCINLDPRKRIASGSPVITETFDAEGHYLSTISKSYKVQQLMSGTDGRGIWFSYPYKVDTKLYDQRTWNTFNGTGEVTLEAADQTVWTDRVPIRSQKYELLRRTQEFDANGRLVKTVDHGRIKHDGGPVDDPIVTTTTHLGLRGDWRFLIDSIHIDPFLIRSDATTPKDQARDMRFKYDEVGRISTIIANLIGTVPLTRRHEDHPAKLVAPTPLSASKDGDVRIAIFHYDDFNNITEFIRPSGLCTKTVFDNDYAEFPREQIAHGEGDPLTLALTGCGTIQYRIGFSWDRGLGKVEMKQNVKGSLTTVSYDGFGRVTEMHTPDPTTGLPVAKPTLQITYSTPVGGPIQRQGLTIRTGPDEWRQVYTYTDGLGSLLLTLEEADPSAGDGGGWLVSGLSRLNGHGAVDRAYKPWFYTGNPLTHPIVTPGTPETVFSRDSFGRLKSVTRPDGAVVERYSYGPLSEEVTAEDGKTSEMTMDGHGRPIFSRRMAEGGDILQRVYYQVLGEPTLILRWHSAKPEEQVVRWMQYDSLGRLVLNAEPNSSQGFSKNPSSDTSLHAWRYAYDNAGHLVGTSDGRGCGKNMTYDPLGRLVAEDYSPCLSSHAAYTPFNKATSTGAEVLNHYDTPEPGQNQDYGASVANLHGRLVSHLDRGGHTRFGYDKRGQLISVAKRLARPESTGLALADQVFYAKVSYDDAGRPIRTTTGAQVAELLGAEGKSEIEVTYGRHGRLRTMGGSYGTLIDAFERNAAGQTTRIRYGDAAMTTLEMQYQNDTNKLGNYKWFRGTASIWSGAPGYTPPLNNESPTTQRVLEHRVFYYQPADLLSSVLDLRSAAEWPQGAKPANYGYMYDQLRRVSKVTAFYWSPDTATVVASDSIPRSSVASRPLEQTFTYDWQGNTISTHDDAGAFPERSIGEITNGTSEAGPNQLLSAGTGKLKAHYDASGNLAQLIVVRPTCNDLEGKCSHRFVYDWDEVGNLSRARRWDYTTMSLDVPVFPNLPTVDPVADLTYRSDAVGKRVIKTKAGAEGPRHTVEVFPTLRLVRAALDASGNYECTADTETIVIPGVGHVIYRPGVPGVGGSKQHVLLEVQDHLGSVGSLIDKDTAELVQRTSFQPYGGLDSEYIPERWRALGSYSRFTGKETDNEVGITYFGARYYMPMLGRWLSPDPLTVHGLAANPNPYAYVSGAVSMATDPTGLCEGSRGAEMCPSGSSPDGSNVVSVFTIGFGGPDANDGSGTPLPVGLPPPPPLIAAAPGNSGSMNVPPMQVPWTYASSRYDMFPQVHTVDTGSTVGNYTMAILQSWGNFFGSLLNVQFQVRGITGDAIESLAREGGFQAELHAAPYVLPMTPIGQAETSAAVQAAVTRLSGVMRGSVFMFLGAGSGAFSPLYIDYPAGMTRPGRGVPVELISKSAYEVNKAQKIAANRALRGMYKEFFDSVWADIHEPHPVRFGGDPTSMGNKEIISPPQHWEVSAWWNALQKWVKGR